MVYTFTYRPDGSGPAWFTGIGQIVGNSIVIDELQRPNGTSFGAGFDSDEVENTPLGGMSLVFNNCAATVKPGGIAFKGNADAGFEAVLTSAQRLGKINGCSFTPIANAGLSGAWYTPSRDGEGVIAQWLDNGSVVVTFFTHGPDGEQFWAFGIGQPNGTSVTMNAMYPATPTSWGRGFNADEVDLQPWGTFTLNWTGCDTMKFGYMSSVQGFGGANRNYQRLTKLRGTQCQQF